MTFLLERLAELRRHLDHLREIRPRVSGPDALASDLSLHNDVLFSLLTVAQVVIDVAGLDYELVIDALDDLEPVEAFLQAVLDRIPDGGDAAPPT